jgi:N-acetylmuramoyl-L-alanine amidase
MKFTFAQRLIIVLGACLILLILNLAAVATPSVTTAAGAALNETVICFVDQGASACVPRPTILAATALTAELRLMTAWLLAGPTTLERAQGIQSAAPANTKLGYLTTDRTRTSIGLILPAGELSRLTEQQVEDILDQFRTTFTPYNFQRLDISAQRFDGVYQPLSKFLKPIEVPQKDSSPQPSPAINGGRVGDGGLAGKTVFLSAGHGWHWKTNLNQYRTQRPVYPQPPCTADGVIEDFNNAEAMNQYLLAYLENAGADTWTVRERDMNTAMLIVDEAAAQSHAARFSADTGWQSSAGGYQGTYRYAATAPIATLTATWTFTPNVSGQYAVYVRFPVLAQAAVDAQYWIQHAGAITPITITQARDADNWRYVGRFPFYGGQAARIWLTNQSATPDAVVAADAIRLGGGMADTPAMSTTLISGKPRWEEQAWTYAKWAGLPTVNDHSDVGVRPVYAEWEKDNGEDAVYVSWHTNGFTGCSDVRGTETYIHSFEPTPGSAELQSAVHTTLIDAIHGAWDGSWPDRGLKAEDFGELRLLDTMPGVLIENGYHDNPIDVESLKDPRFNQLAARAIYHGLVDYWHALDPNVPLIYLPEPPQQVVMRNSGMNQITVGWQPGPIDGSGPLGEAAASYRVYLSADGFGWSNPIEVAGTMYTLTNLAPGQLIFARITGVNAGGESLSAPVLAARVSGPAGAPILLVYGYERLDAAGAIGQVDTPEGFNRRVLVDRINRQDYIVQHAEVIPFPFDSTQHAVVSQGSIELADYRLIDWIAGREQAPFPALTASDQAQLSSYLTQGGALLISGAEIGAELEGAAFYAQTLRASLSSDDAGTYAASATPNGLFAGLDPFEFDDGTRGTYDVDKPDSFEAVNGAVKALVYNTGAPAAVQYAGDGCARLIYLGFPFETVPRTARQSLLNRIIGFVGPACLGLSPRMYLPMVGRGTSLQPVCRDAVINGGFETGQFAPDWKVLAANPLPQLNSGAAYHGQYAAQIGAATSSEPITQVAYSSVEQDFSVPANVVTATVSWARWRWSGDAQGFDAQYALIIDQDGVVHTLVNEDEDDLAWNTITFDLKPYAGQDVKLRLGVGNDGTGGSTGMLIDDVQANLCTP